jgi:hypothetical protein
MLADYILSALKQSDIRQLLAEEEAEQVKQGVFFPHKVTAAVFVRMGMEIEEQQYVLHSIIH